MFTNEMIQSNAFVYSMITTLKFLILMDFYTSTCCVTLWKPNNTLAYV